MRIVQLLTQGRGGPVDHAADVAAAFADLGHESHLVGPPGEYVERLGAGGVRWHQAQMSHKLDLRGGRSLERLLDELRPDLVHCQDRRAGMAGRLWGWRTGVPTVYTLHGVPDSLADLVPGNRAVARRGRIDRFAYLTAERHLSRVPRSRVVTPCRAVATYAREHVGIAAERVHVVANGVPTRWTAHRPADPGRAEGPLVAAWLGVMAPVKRVDGLVRAAAGVPGLRLRLVGDGPERRTVERTASDVGLLPRLDLTGFLGDPLPALADAHVFVLPSAAEACPIALLQAMALGLACVATRVGGVPEILRHDHDGVLVDAGDDAALGRALRALAEDPVRRARLGARARERVLEMFTLRHSADRLLEVYRELVR